jgi:5'-nucleotidase
VDGLRLADGAPLRLEATYRLVTNNFLAGGGDGLAVLKSITANRADTGFLEHDALAEHLARLGQVGPPDGPRVDIDTRTARN